MKQKMTVLGLVLGAALMVAGCSSDSPTAPKPSPTPAAYSIGLTASSDSAQVGSAIVLTAQVSQGSGNVPDNTSVTFQLYGCGGPGVAFSGGSPSFENGFCQIARTTTNGRATATLLSSVASGFEVTAALPGLKVSKQVRFYDPVNAGKLAIYGVTPNVGPATGGQQVQVQGNGFELPLLADFTVGGQTRHAIVANVNASGTEMTIITPNTEFLTVDTAADLTITAAVGKTSETKDTLVEGYIFDVNTGPEGAPEIYSITPARGLTTGNEQVTIIGKNFFPAVLVKLGEENANVVSVSADNTTVVMTTPVHSGPPQLPGDAPVTVDVQICIQNDCTGANHTVTRTDGWTWMVPATQASAPVIYQIIPNKGSARGGEDIKILGANLCGLVSTTTGQCIGAPTVSFSIGGAAQVLSYSADGKELHVITPVASVAPLLVDTLCNVSVTNSKGTATLANGFMFLADTRPPEVYSVSPNKGSARGGDTVTVFGRFLIAPVKVEFGAGRVAETISVSTDGTSVEVRTPAWGVTPLTVDTAVAVIVTTQAGTGRDQTVSLTNGFLYIAEQPTPELYALSPNSGSVEGGTRVTITGAGFQYPVQVFFGDRQAQVVSSNFNQVICVSPSITVTGPATPTNVDVTVKNMLTGKTSNALPYRYGEAMFISGITPNHGPADGYTTVTIFGQGFVGPVRVFIALGTDIDAEVLSVSGTEIVVKTQPLPNRECGTSSGPVNVVNLSSNIKAVGPAFNYEAPAPLITSVDITAPSKPVADNTILQYNPLLGGGCALNPAWTTYTGTIHGANFQANAGASAMVVSIPGVSANIPTTFVDDHTLTFAFPDLSGVPIQEVSCVTGTGACGQQYVDTPVDLTVTNQRNSCLDVLRGAFIIKPCDTTCRVNVLTLSMPQFIGPYVAGTSQSVTVTITRGTGNGPVTVNLAYYGVVSGPPTVTIPPGVSTGSLSITSAAAGSGTIVASVGSGLCEVSASSSVTFTPAPLPLTLQVVKNGTGDGILNQDSPAPSRVVTSGSDTQSMVPGTQVTLSAVVVKGAFGGWSGSGCGCTGTATPCSFVLDAAATCIATFNQ